MRRRWGILTAMLTLMAGLTLATGSGSASAGTIGISPGGPIHLVSSVPVGNASAHHGISHAATSTNWHLQRQRQVLLVLGRAGRLQQQLGRADRQRGGLLGEPGRVLRLVRDVPGRLGLVLQHGAPR
jgi:hypothetical protein